MVRLAVDARKSGVETGRLSRCSKAPPESGVKSPACSMRRLRRSPGSRSSLQRRRRRRCRRRPWCSRCRRCNSCRWSIGVAALTAGGVADARLVALAGRSAGDRRSARADAAEADVASRAGVAVTARGLIRTIGELRLIQTRVADLAGVVRIHLSGHIADAADKACARQLRIRPADAGARVADALAVAGIGRRAGDGIAADAGSSAVASVGLGAGVLIVAGRAQRFRRIGHADAGLADVVGAGVVRAAERAVRLIRDRAGSGRRVARHAHLAGSRLRAGDGRARADAGDASIAGGAGVAVIAGRAVGRVGIGQEPSLGLQTPAT